MRRRAFLLLLLLLAPGYAAAAWYGGGALGYTAYGHTVSSFDDGSIVVGEIDDQDAGWKLFSGFRFLPFFGVEAGYVDLGGEFDSKPTFRGVSDGGGFIYRRGPVSVDIARPVGYYGAAVGRLPIGPRFALFGKLGLFDWRADVTTVNRGLAATVRDGGTSSMWGAGFEVGILPLLRLRSEWERYAEIVGGDIDLISVGLVVGVPVP